MTQGGAVVSAFGSYPKGREFDSHPCYYMFIECWQCKQLYLEQQQHVCGPRPGATPYAPWDAARPHSTGSLFVECPQCKHLYKEDHAHTCTNAEREIHVSILTLLQLMALSMGLGILIAALFTSK